MVFMRKTYDRAAVPASPILIDPPARSRRRTLAPLPGQDHEPLKSAQDGFGDWTRLLR
jgi:hypothetical protein